MKQLKVLAILLAVLLVTSCNKEEEVSGIGDVMVITKKSGVNTVYGLSLYAYTFSTFTKVTAVNSANPDKVYTLKSTKGNFSYDTPENEFSTTPPPVGVYTFSATFENGAEKKFENTLTTDLLPIPAIDRCEYNEPYDRLEIDWQVISNAASYAVNILEGSTIVFASNEIKASDLYNSNTNTFVGAYAVRPLGGGWEVGYVPEAGKNYIVRLFAYRYEANGGGYNMQCVSMADKSIVWGE